MSAPLISEDHQRQFEEQYSLPKNSVNFILQRLAGSRFSEIGPALHCSAQTAASRCRKYLPLIAACSSRVISISEQVLSHGSNTIDIPHVGTGLVAKIDVVLLTHSNEKYNPINPPTGVKIVVISSVSGHFLYVSRAFAGYHNDSVVFTRCFPDGLSVRPNLCGQW